MLFPGTALKWKSLPFQGFWHRSTRPIPRDRAKPLRMPAFHSDAGVRQVLVKPRCSWPGPEHFQPGAPVSWGFQPGTWSAKCVCVYMCVCVHVCLCVRVCEHIFLERESTISSDPQRYQDPDTLRALTPKINFEG